MADTASPVASPIHGGPATCTSATASHLFRDGLHSVLACLTLKELHTASQVSRHWLSTAATLPPRSFTFAPTETKLRAVLSSLLQSQSNGGASLARHIASLGDALSLGRVNVDLLEQSCRAFPNLTSLKFTVEDRIVEDLDRFDALRWPHKLTEVTIHHAQTVQNGLKLFSRLLARLPTGLRGLHLSASSFSSISSAELKPLLMRFDQLEHLTLFHPDRSSCPALLELVTLIGSNLRSLDFDPTDMKVNLTPKMLKQSLHLPQLRSGREIFWHFLCTWYDPTFVDALVESMPRLEELSLPENTNPRNYLALPGFASLRTLALETSKLYNQRMNLDDISTAVSQCGALTSLELTAWERSFSDEQWRIIFDGTPSLTSLRLTDAASSLEFLRHPTLQRRLRTLYIVGRPDVEPLNLAPVALLSRLTSLTLAPSRCSPASFVSTFGSSDRSVLPCLESMVYSCQHPESVIKWNTSAGVTRWYGAVMQKLPSFNFRTEEWKHAQSANPLQSSLQTTVWSSLG
jgi:hypothetical protein